MILTALKAAQTSAADSGHHYATCVVDSGGHILGLIRDTGAAISAAHSAETKARTAIYLQTDTGGLPPDSPFIPAMTAGLPYPVNMFAGGMLLLRGGVVVGAVGVGGSPNPGDDLYLAEAVRDILQRDDSGLNHR